MFRENLQNCFTPSISEEFDLVRKICYTCMRNSKESKRQMTSSGFTHCSGVCEEPKGETSVCLLSDKSVS